MAPQVAMWLYRLTDIDVRNHIVSRGPRPAVARILYIAEQIRQRFCRPAPGAVFIKLAAQRTL